MDNTFAVPNFCRRLAIVSNDAIGVAVASSFVHQSGEYTAVFRAPTMRGDAILFQRELAKCGNALRFVRPELLLLHDVPVDVGDFLEKGSQAGVIRTATVEEISRRLESAGFCATRQALPCRPSDIALGTLSARRSARFLVIDASASPITDGENRKLSRRHLVAVDGDDLFTHVLAANYAFAIGADLQILPRCANDLRASVYAAIEEKYEMRNTSGATRSSVALDKFECEVGTRVDRTNRSFVTFITDGLPYGYAVPDVPSTHIFAWSAPYCITSSIYFEREHAGTIAALTIDAGDFEESEIDAVHDALHSVDCVTFAIPSKAANVALVSQFIMAIPLDFIFICSHGRETPGIRFTVHVPDLSGQIHELVYDGAFSQTSDVEVRDGTEMVRIAELKAYRSYGGEAWNQLSGELRAHVGRYVVEHGDELAIVSKEPLEFVPHSSAVKLPDGYLMLNSLQAFDPLSAPVMFNNSCLSFYDGANAAVSEGARAYVGTLWPVGTHLACDLATELVEKHRGQPLAQSLWEIQRALVADSRDRIYVHVGCHFTRLCVPFQGDTSAAQLKRVRDALTRWRRALRTQTSFGKTMAEDIIAHLRVAETRLSPRPK